VPPACLAAATCLRYEYVEELVDSMVWLAKMRRKAILQLSRESAGSCAQRPHILYSVKLYVPGVSNYKA
jgi:hypothetical protein